MANTTTGGSIYSPLLIDFPCVRRRRINSAALLCWAVILSAQRDLSSTGNESVQEREVVGGVRSPELALESKTGVGEGEGRVGEAGVTE